MVQGQSKNFLSRQSTNLKENNCPTLKIFIRNMSLSEPNYKKYKVSTKLRLSLAQYHERQVLSTSTRVLTYVSVLFSML